VKRVRNSDRNSEKNEERSSQVVNQQWVKVTVVHYCCSPSCFHASTSRLVTFKNRRK